MTLFEKIIAREIPAAIVYEDEHTVAFRDISPKAPVHILVVPRKAIPRLSQAESQDAELLGHCLNAVRIVAAQEGLSDYRVVINCGPQAGQTVYHLHLHLMGGREMGWPPG